MQHILFKGRVDLSPGAGAAQPCAALQALPGIGEWTAQYVAMRALKNPDAFRNKRQSRNWYKPDRKEILS